VHPAQVKKACCNYSFIIFINQYFFLVKYVAVKKDSLVSPLYENSMFIIMSINPAMAFESLKIKIHLLKRHKYCDYYHTQLPLMKLNIVLLVLLFILQYISALFFILFFAALFLLKALLGVFFASPFRKTGLQA
jgi:hypothetical protein